jgi:hypothetical protein
VSIKEEVPSIGDRAGGVRFYEVIDKSGERGRVQLTRGLERFYKDPRLLSYRFKCEKFPLRYANGAVLPIIRLDAGEYFCLFYRDAFPVGWNIANGASASIDEMLNPERTILREFGEELFACDHGRRVIYTIGAGNDLAPSSLQRRTLDVWGKRRKDRDLSKYERRPTPMKWIEGPDRVRVRYASQTQHCPVRFVHIRGLALGLRTPKQRELSERNHEARSGS